MDPGESAAETCVREALEETGLEVRLTKLLESTPARTWLWNILTVTGFNPSPSALRRRLLAAN